MRRVRYTTKNEKVNQAMGALNFFWNTDSVDLYDKYTIFMAVPLNLLLWGCESWAITKKNTKNIRSVSNKMLQKDLEYQMGRCT